MSSCSIARFSPLLDPFSWSFYCDCIPKFDQSGQKTSVRTTLPIKSTLASIDTLPQFNTLAILTHFSSGSSGRSSDLMEKLTLLGWSNYRLNFQLLGRQCSCNALIILCTTFALGILFLLCRFIYHDYKAYLNLGPGGTPSNFRGYLRVSALRLFTLKYPLEPPNVLPGTVGSTSYLLRLPDRFSSRPQVDGIAPHRQIEQRPHTEIHKAMGRALNSLADDNTSFLSKGNSCFEKHGLALFFRTLPKNVRPDVAQHGAKTHESSYGIRRTCGDSAEICHLHPSVS